MRESEYIVDRLKAEVQHYKDLTDAYEREFQALKTECLLGTAVALISGFVIGAGITWLL